MRGDGGLGWSGSSKGGAEWSDSGSILRMEDLVIDVGSYRKRRVKFDLCML